jgi:hypothetical protein
MNDIYANDPTPPISEKQRQELAASLDSAGSAVPLRPLRLAHANHKRQHLRRR